MLSVTLIFLLLSITLVVILFYLVVYAFVMDFKLAGKIIGNAIKLSLSEKERKEYITIYHSLFNTSLKQLAADIVQIKDKELLSELELDDIEKVKIFKKTLNSLLKDKNFEFMSYEEVEKTLKERHMFSFMNQVYMNTNMYSNPQMLLLYKNIEKYEKNQLTEQKLYTEIQRTLKMSPNIAKQELSNLGKMKNNKSISILLMKLFSQKESRNDRYEFQKMYNAITQ